nr:MAG TPA: hypothetical protein [Caudoviricetes sp.]
MTLWSYGRWLCSISVRRQVPRQSSAGWTAAGIKRERLRVRIGSVQRMIRGIDLARTSPV